MGVLGIVLADLALTAVFTLVTARWFAPLIRPVFSRGAPRGAQFRPATYPTQPRAPGDRCGGPLLSEHFATLREVGLYSMGATFGLGLKLFLSAFEYAWTPFFLGVMKEPDAKDIYTKISTYYRGPGLAGSGVVFGVHDLIRFMTAPAFHAAAFVTPWIALGVMFQGLYLVGSIGLIITRRTSRYPIATGIAGIASITSNVLLIPRFGLMGAAWANAASVRDARGVHSLVVLARVPDTVPSGGDWRRWQRRASAPISRRSSPSDPPPARW